MNKKEFDAWCALIEKSLPTLDAQAQRLKEYGAEVGRDSTRATGEVAYIAAFTSTDGLARTTIRFLRMDHQAPQSDIVITNMTTLPDSECRKGYGSNALETLIEWARSCSFREMLGAQIRKGNTASERLLKKHGFEQCPPPNPCNDYRKIL
jgi:RimJ/RimL family protein N-acetyltransferase